MRGGGFSGCIFDPLTTRQKPVPVFACSSLKLRLSVRVDFSSSFSWIPSEVGCSLLHVRCVEWIQGKPIHQVYICLTVTLTAVNEEGVYRKWLRATSEE